VKVSVFRSAVCAVLAALAATAMAAEEAKPGPKFEFHGFVGASLFAQDAVFNNSGQQIFFVTRTPNTDRLLFGGDARQTRLNWSLAGSKIFGGATPKAVAEIDFFGTAGTSATNVTPRLRLSYGELNWGDTIFRAGQFNMLLLGTFSPTSVGHIPQSYAYNAGYLGGRTIGLEGTHSMPVGDMKVEGSLQVLRPSQGNLGSEAATNLTFAESSGTPALQARLRLVKPKLLDVYLVGHWNQIDRNGIDNNKAVPAALGDTQTTVVGSAGVKVTAGPLTVQGQGYVGKNLADFTAALGQFVRTQDGDLHEWGAWGQVGYNITPEFSAWAFLGTDHPNYKEVEDLANAGAFSTATAIAPATAPTPAQILASSRGNARLQNVTFAGMLRYMEGGYALGLEYIHMRTKYLVPQTTSATRSPEGVLNGNQLMFSGMYFF
jgi:hypothetical protein